METKYNRLRAEMERARAPLNSDQSNGNVSNTPGASGSEVMGEG